MKITTKALGRTLTALHYLLIVVVITTPINVSYYCSCFYMEKSIYMNREKNGKNSTYRVFVSKPAQKKSNQLRTKIIINKRKKEENEKNKQSRMDDFKLTSNYKLIEELIDEYPYKLPDYNIDKEPFIILKDKIKGEYLKGYELPFNLIDPVKYELLKLIGKICDPFKPLCSHSLTPRLFISKLFTNRSVITYDDFCYKLEYKINFYMPSYTELFKYEKELLWKEWIAIRNLKEVSPVTPLDDHERVDRILEEGETTLPIVIKKTNREINSQGIHPSILKMFFDFLNIEKCEKVLKRDNAFLKLETIKNQIKNREFLEGIRPDYLYIMFNKKANEYYSNFNEKEFEKTYQEAVNYNNMTQKMISENSLYKKQRKQFSEQTKKSLMKFYDIQLPSFFKEYIKKKEENYKLIQARIKRMIDNKYLKRKQRRDEKALLGNTPAALEAPGHKTDLTDDKKKKKKKKKKR
ncbi:hypothetical protein MKS88_000974 [Plasmodium brasilianum]|uniref:Uncharacterized protein n=2 Tax=Plasmodium (Plasmodium) TaxID=418103 RepID=A0A1D3JII9_PLAMA|nr:conserved Plasmodium protein, unknown function [Plasmodium malariae]KAI4840739.1 hypothetical protein MKS88_000974 [Plasmodium brasilianum]SBT86306.1 conserved Plasmodium protein, unknown function [Plasmodium malariae]